jgi:SAM-dependent methyltransferase
LSGNDGLVREDSKRDAPPSVLTRVRDSLTQGEPSLDPISEALGRHYAETFERHGPTTQGVDWGTDRSRAVLRLDKMLAVMGREPEAGASLLDVGCGYGDLLTHALSRSLSIDYVGIDVAENMIQWATGNVVGGKFVRGYVLVHRFADVFDYVVCNGILTQKLQVPGLEMDNYARRLVRRLFQLCRRGMAFNVMTTKVNYFANHLYYRNPAELLSWCISEITPHVRLDHAYPLYEFTMYLYHAPHAG